MYLIHKSNIKSNKQIAILDNKTNQVIGISDKPIENNLLMFNGIDFSILDDSSNWLILSNTKDSWIAF